MPLFTKAGLPKELDKGFVKLAQPADAKGFIQACAALRFWDRADGA
jgi:catalase